MKGLDTIIMYIKGRTASRTLIPINPRLDPIIQFHGQIATPEDATLGHFVIGQEPIATLPLWRTEH